MGKVLTILAVLIMAVVLFAYVLARMASGTAAAAGTAASQGPVPAAPDATAVEVLFAYSSEKQDWITAATTAFNAHPPALAGGKHAHVTAMPMGSGECVDRVLDGSLHAHLVSPASAAFIKLGNAKARTATGRDLIPQTENLVLSPVVIAMWKPMAEALGWPQKSIGWKDILALARSPQGWASAGQPQWGAFRFGHTHPEYSNSGLMTLFAEIYAGAGKVRALQAQDLDSPAVADFMAGIEQSVVHYGSSTGFFGKAMYDHGPSYLTAAVLYENMVIESYQHHTEFPLIALYPAEGTFWSDHPAGIVDREWVGPAEKEAAEAYLKFLLDRPQQEAAMAAGFRPGSTDVALGAPIDQAHGCDPQEPKTTLEVPTPEIMDRALQLWHVQKKHAHITLVLDVSGSMNDEGKLVHAREGAVQLLHLLDEQDDFSLLPFNGQLMWMDRNRPLANGGREALSGKIASLIADDGTALYDAIADAYDDERKNPTPGRINAIVVLTDGTDTDSKSSLAQLLATIKGDSEGHSIKVFTIGYGSDANMQVLISIADATQAKSYVGTPQNIGTVFKDISTFF